MKTYRVKFLTQKGQVERIIKECEDLNKITWELTNKYGQFITLSSQEIPTINRAAIITMFLDYVNNFTSVLMFANYYRLNEDKANKLINLGRKLNNA